MRATTSSGGRAVVCVIARRVSSARVSAVVCCLVLQLAVMNAGSDAPAKTLSPTRIRMTRYRRVLGNKTFNPCFHTLEYSTPAYPAGYCFDVQTPSRGLRKTFCQCRSSSPELYMCSGLAACNVITIKKLIIKTQGDCTEKDAGEILQAD